MKNERIRLIALNAIVAALYAVFTVLTSLISYGDIQFRLSEIMILLSLRSKKYLPGLILGCLAANLFSPLWQYDVPFGTLATVIALLLIVLVNNIYFVPIIGAVVNGVIVGTSLFLAFDLPLLPSMGWVALGEFAVLVLGVVLVKLLSLNKGLCKHAEALERNFLF